MVFVYRIGSLGDSIVALPAIHLIKKLHPNEKIILLTSNNQNYMNTWEVLKYANVFDNVIFYNKNFLSLIKFINNIRSINDNKILYYLAPFRNKNQIIRDKIIFKLAGINKIFGLDESSVQIAKRDKKGKLLKLEKEYDRLLKIVNKDYESFKIPLPLLKIDQKINDKINFFIAKNNLVNKKLIAIAPGTKMPCKKWDINNYLELMRKIEKNYDKISFVIVGGKEDFQDGEYLEERVNKCINFAGTLNIIESATLLEKCSLFIGNDTGTMHLASIMGVPVIGIFSARDNPGKWEPYGNNNLILRKTIHCEGCMLEKCETNECLKLITVGEVYEKVENYLQ